MPVWCKSVTLMVPHKSLPVAAVCLLLSVSLSGCFRDPNVRKQKFVAEGDAYFKEGKYPEAQIDYARALQIDPQYAVAVYKSAQCSMRLGNWNGAYRELLRTVELDPLNLPAQLDLGKILLAGGKAQEAKDRALLVLKQNSQDADAKMFLSDAESALGNRQDSLTAAREAVAL